MARRDFLKLAGTAVAGTAAANWSAMAGPFEADDFEKLVPADKKLSADWVKSLFERGQPEKWRGAELAYVGMPVGGICTGQLYLGGDGKLWYWDIFSPASSSDFSGMSSGVHYSKPLIPTSPLAQGVAIKIVQNGSPQVRELDARGFADISFRGEYPIGRVEYRDSASAVAVELEAFSPFIPLDPESSGLPATILQYTVTNTSTAPVEVELAAWLQNAVCLYDDTPTLGVRRNTVRRTADALTLGCSVEPPPVSERVEKRPDIVFEDFEKETYEGWSVEGTAFGSGPIAKDQIPSYQGDVGAHGQRLVNSHASAPGKTINEKDAATGSLTSKSFVIERNFVSFLLGGGKHPGTICVNLLVDGQVAATATGNNSNRMRPVHFDVSQFAGKTAHLEIVDAETGDWGNIGVDYIVFTDTPSGPHLEDVPGYGTMALSLLQPVPDDTGVALLPEDATTQAIFAALRQNQQPNSATCRFGRTCVGALGRRLSLQPGQSGVATFVLTWFFPNYPTAAGEFAAITDIRKLHRHYAARFTSASEVAEHIAAHFEKLAVQTRLWNRTWYDSTLPYWLLDRTFLTIDTLATQTCHWFDNGRFYAWEGVNCCAGTCQHVWQYAQAVARIFPQLERDTRERVDLGLAWDPSGAMGYRAENGHEVALDGFAGTLLRVYREHQMSADSEFLKRVWPRVRISLQYLMSQDKNGVGLLEGGQANTLDSTWYGPMGWISSLYLAALQAGREMALEMGDSAFANRCERLVDAGRKNIVARLFNGQYFIHKPDPTHPEAINTNDGCHIDQVFGQSFAWQLGLGRVVPGTETISALESLWKYNFTPDVGSYRANFKVIKTGRWYALPGEGGLLMCTWPKGGAEKARGNGGADWSVGYFNECMTGFEYQVASHMIWEGNAQPDLVEKGLAITRMIHDRYGPAKRNPYNEIECSDHYARAMSSYGVFLALCGYEYHGPKGHLGFAPRVHPEDFRAAFTTAEGWGTFTQKREAQGMQCGIALLWGKLKLNTIALEAPLTLGGPVTITLDDVAVPAKATREGGRLLISLEAANELREGQILKISLA
jgi:uncharacterized protein (DUF608 family)